MSGVLYILVADPMLRYLWATLSPWGPIQQFGVADDLDMNATDICASLPVFREGLRSLGAICGLELTPRKIVTIPPLQLRR